MHTPVRKKKKLEVLSSEAFAYSLESGLGTERFRKYYKFSTEGRRGTKHIPSKLSYSFHLVTPGNDTLYEADYGYIDKHEEEELTDIQIESQMELDSSFFNRKVFHHL